MRQYVGSTTTVPGEIRELARVARGKLITRIVCGPLVDSSIIPTLVITDSQMTEFKKTLGEVSSIEEMLSSLSDDHSTPPPERLTIFSTLKVMCQSYWLKKTTSCSIQQSSPLFKDSRSNRLSEDRSTTWRVCSILFRVSRLVASYPFMTYFP